MIAVSIMKSDYKEEVNLSSDARGAEEVKPKEVKEIFSFAFQEQEGQEGFQPEEAKAAECLTTPNENGTMLVWETVS